MNTVKVTPYSRRLPELRTSLSLLQLGKVLMMQGARQHSGITLGDTLIELTKMERKITEISDEIQMTELLHQAAILLGNYKEYQVSSL